ncbi:unnamed protein product [Allacma fusca]|uniref:CBF1-interacting co-repressor CIR N-terminal domain-containing protein n=1 Tax=Allacma fusca TaxID=39272 RepID=A0A8J2Q601_9HEXA|nr:unnamed protein product [Allacma fusca]
MNILPHKSWHVRTKKNIAKVRKDEAQAAEEEKERQRRIALAAQEARTSFLRERAGQRFEDTATTEVPTLPLEKVADIIQKDGHVNFFQEIEDGVIQKNKINVEHEEEKKKEQEDYEKKIGYLTYLGQNSLEHSKEKPWYATISRSLPTAVGTSSKLVSKDSDGDLSALKEAKFKDFHDPLKDIRKYLHTPGVKAKLDKIALKRSNDQLDSSSEPKRLKKEASTEKLSKAKKKSKKSKKKHRKSKHKKSKHRRKSPSSSGISSSGSEYESDDSYEKKKQDNLAKLRAERLEREKEEGKKAERLMAQMRGETIEEEKPREPPPTTRMKQKYNSQFNPQLARQNYDD